MVDISGRVPFYDISLCKSLVKEIGVENSFFFLSPRNKNYPLCESWFIAQKDILPSFLQERYNIFRRLTKALEVFYNYISLISLVKKEKIDVVHFQWLPLLEICSFEKYVLKKIKKSGAKIILTVHNLYPHNCKENAKLKYKNRFIEISKYVDQYIVHTEVSKKDLCNLFNIDHEKVNVVYHGIFEPQSDIKESHTSKKLTFTMFGTQSMYKGTDLFVDACSKLNDSEREKININIVGPTQSDFYQSYSEKAKKIGIYWNPSRVSDIELYEIINKSHVIFLPYRAISQSGVLLQALYFKKSIVTSDLPSFKETLSGYDDDWFFKSEDSNSLSALMRRYINNEIDIERQKKIIERLNVKYSWDESSKKTVCIYLKLLSN